MSSAAHPASGLPRALGAWLESHVPEMLARLETLARLESPSSDRAAQEPVFAALAGWLEALGWRTRRLTGRETGGALLARPRTRPWAGAQLLLGHVDTVWPRGQLASMPLRRDGDRLYGPGVYDMKGGLVQMLAALEALRALDLVPALEPVIFLNADEEIGSPESARHVARLARCVKRVFVLEPSLGPDGRAKTARKAVGRFTLRVAGRAAHAGLDPDGGVSAIAELARQIERVQALADPQRGITVNVGTVSGGIAPNVIAPSAEARLETRVLTREDARRMQRALEGLAPIHSGARLEVSGGFAKAPLEPTPRNRALYERARGLAAELGFALGEGTAGGASDGNTASLHAATLDGIGAVGGGAHAPDEHLLVSKLAERSALLALLLLDPPGNA